MADDPQAKKTPLQEAKTPVIDALIKSSLAGLVKTVPDGMKPGSDIANLSVMGYDPTRYYTGRSPLEAVSIGIAMKDDDLALRCNLVTLGAENDELNKRGEKNQESEWSKFGEKTMLDYSAGEISTEEAHILIADFAEHLKGLKLQKNGGIDPRKTAENAANIENAEENFQNITDDIKKFPKNDGIEPPKNIAAKAECFTFYGGVSYRNCLIIENGRTGTVCVPPHDISGKKIGGYLPRGVYGGDFTEMIRASYEFLSRSEINKKRVLRGQNPANAVWLWGEGKKPLLDDFYSLNGKRGAVISAVDLVKGIGLAANMKIYEVEGATGTVDTNFEGKAKAVLEAVSDGCDFVYLHIEAADECGHHGDREGKIRSIEKIDGVIGYIKNALDEKNSEYSLMILPDHPTPLSTLTHSAEPVPYMIFDGKKNLSNGVAEYDETETKKGEFVGSGTELLRKFLEI
jgi:2,3-bisphosphoglycerate-independent phosphoglycerate mutase